MWHTRTIKRYPADGEFVMRDYESYQELEFNKFVTHKFGGPHGYYSGTRSGDDAGGFLKIAVPGFKKEDLQVTIKKDTLIICCKSNEKIKKSIFLPHTESMIDKESFKASVEDGVLSFTYSLITKKDSHIEVEIK